MASTNASAPFTTTLITLHLHIAINKIHPKRHTIHNPYNDHKTLAQLCEKLERDYGLEPDNHRAQKAAPRIGLRIWNGTRVLRACLAGSSASAWSRFKARRVGMRCIGSYVTTA